MKPISFCINTAANEKEYVKLLLRSLKDNTQIENHEILIFVDRDNQNTYEELLEIKKSLPQIKIYQNKSEYSIGAQRNVSLLFDAAVNDIVCYLHSDMVVGKHFDKYIIQDMLNENTVLSLTRIEPPLHPNSPEKIVKDFGTTPEKFEYDSFNKFVEELQLQQKPVDIGHFAPFVIYKSTWFNVLGGYDTQFRCSREDSDFIIKLARNKLDAVQSWMAYVYHFTCVSSRGKNWFDNNDKDAQYVNALQQHADEQEFKRFIRKWGYFGHHVQPVYNTKISIEIDRYVDFNILYSIEPFFRKVYLSDDNVAGELFRRIKFESHYYSNLRWGYSTEHWNNVKHLFNGNEFENHIFGNINKSELNSGTVLYCKYSDLVSNMNKDTLNIIQNINQIVSQNDIGNYVYAPFTIKILDKQDISDQYNRFNGVDDLLDKRTFKFE